MQYTGTRHVCLVHWSLYRAVICVRYAVLHTLWKPPAVGCICQDLPARGSWATLGTLQEGDLCARCYVALCIAFCTWGSQHTVECMHVPASTGKWQVAPVLGTVQDGDICAALYVALLGATGDGVHAPASISTWQVAARFG